MTSNIPSTQRLSGLTKTVATLFGNIFAVMAKDEVMAAAKPTASTDLTMKHRLMNGAPAGTRFNNLQRMDNQAQKSIRSVVTCALKQMQII